MRCATLSVVKRSRRDSPPPPKSNAPIKTRTPLVCSMLDWFCSYESSSREKRAPLAVYKNLNAVYADLFSHFARVHGSVMPTAARTQTHARGAFSASDLAPRPGPRGERRSHGHVSARNVQAKVSSHV